MTNMSYWQGVNLRYSVSNENTRAYLEINMMWKLYNGLVDKLSTGSLVFESCSFDLCWSWTLYMLVMCLMLFTAVSGRVSNPSECPI